MIAVRDINIKNEEFLNILNEYKDVLLHRETPGGLPKVERELKLTYENDNANDYISDEYMHSIIRKGRGHAGFPDAMKGFRGLKYDEWARPGEGEDIKIASRKINTDLNSFLSSNNNALNACYPPGGFISWHNNANASGYNIIITYSETGDGWFDYWDLDKKERVRIPDKPGWQAKMTYFGSYEEPDKLCYHAAYTDCYRITVAFVFKQADNFWEEVIEDIENPC